MNADLLFMFLSGALAMGCGAIALFFLRFWRQHGISLFGFFAVAFVLLGIERIALASGANQGEYGPLVYLLRLAAFAVIIAGIVAQNRRRIG